MKLSYLIIALFPFLPAISLAQPQVQISLFPGYHLINSDQPAVGDNASKTNWVFGGNVSLQTTYRGNPIELTVGYQEGNSTIFTFVSTAELFDPTTYDFDLRYRTLPVEILYRHKINTRFELLGGINVAAQHRIIHYSGNDERINFPNDRLLSLGIGLSGKLRTQLFTFSSENGAVFANLSARWTEFIFHNKRGRKLDDFTLRHLTVYPEIGVKFNLNAFDKVF